MDCTLDSFIGNLNLHFISFKQVLKNISLSIYLLIIITNLGQFYLESQQLPQLSIFIDYYL
jgi:hypothetical protein